MLINSISDFRRAIHNGPYAWPGGYPLYFITARQRGVVISKPCQERPTPFSDPVLI